MNAVTSLKNAESRMVNAIAAATAEVDAIGTSSLDGALANLEAAVSRAKGRLDAALAFMSTKIGELTQECEDMAAGIEQDVAEAVAMPSRPPSVPHSEPAAVEPVNAPSVATTQPEGTQEPGSVMGIRITEGSTQEPIGSMGISIDPTGTDGTTEPVPVNRIKELIGAEPSSNGHGKGKSTRSGTKGKDGPKGRGKGRDKK